MADVAMDEYASAVMALREAKRMRKVHEEQARQLEKVEKNLQEQLEKILPSGSTATIGGHPMIAFKRTERVAHAQLKKEHQDIYDMCTRRETKEVFDSEFFRQRYAKTFPQFMVADWEVL